MDNTLLINKDYYSNLDIRAFSNSFKSTTACYKLYWLDSILSIYFNDPNCCRVISFDRIFDEMIVQAWYTKAYYKLRLGNRVGGYDQADIIEASIELILEHLDSDFKINSPEESIRELVIRSHPLIDNLKWQLSRYVPIRYLNPFTGNSNNSYSKMMPLISELFEKNKVPYRIIDLHGMRCIEINEAWAQMFDTEYYVLKQWIAFEKVKFLQKYNQDVPAIVNKLDYSKGVRDLTRLRILWDEIMKLDEVKDIYSNQVVDRKNYALDHFVPWAFIGNNELWNICPIDPGLNSSKSDNLPEWSYSEALGRCQYLIYREAMADTHCKILALFNRCRDKHLNADWALKLYNTKGIDEAAFINDLTNHLSPLYRTAQNQGFMTWNYTSEQIVRSFFRE